MLVPSEEEKEFDPGARVMDDDIGRLNSLLLVLAVVFVLSLPDRGLKNLNFKVAFLVA